MKKKIYIYDIIGIKSGMDYYLNSFKKLLNENEIECSIRSNYLSEGVIFFSNIFKGSKIIRILKLIRNLIKFLRYSNKDISVFLYYGTYIDLFFLFSSSEIKKLL